MLGIDKVWGVDDSELDTKMCIQDIEPIVFDFDSIANENLIKINVIIFAKFKLSIN